MEHLLPQGLSPDERDILILKLEKELTYAEIAPILGISEVSCRSRFFRAKAHFLLLTKKTLVIESYEADSSGFEKSYSVAKWEVDTGTFVFQNDSETQKSVG